MASLHVSTIPQGFRAIRTCLPRYRSAPAARPSVNTTVSPRHSLQSNSGSALRTGLYGIAAAGASVTVGLGVRAMAYRGYMPEGSAEYILNNYDVLAGGVAAMAALGAVSLGISITGARSLRQTVLSVQEKLASAAANNERLIEENSFLKQDLSIALESRENQRREQIGSLIRSGLEQAGALAPWDTNGLRDVLIELAGRLELLGLKGIPEEVAALNRRLESLMERSVFSITSPAENEIKVFAALAEMGVGCSKVKDASLQEGLKLTMSNAQALRLKAEHPYIDLVDTSLNPPAPVNEEAILGLIPQDPDGKLPESAPVDDLPPLD